MLGVCCDEKVKKMMLTAKNIVREKEREGERKREGAGMVKARKKSRN